jgi:MerR family transcriptional regulator, copper efflux regulator
MHIGNVAKLTAASPKAIRLYESLGLLGAVKRKGSYRIYSASDLQTIQWIRQAQDLGFKLAELKDLLGALGTPDWQAVAAAIAAKRERVHTEMAVLAQRDARLAALAAELATCDGAAASTAACDVTGEAAS